MYEGPGIYEHYKGGRYRVLGLSVPERSKPELEPREVVYEPITPGSLLEDVEDVAFWTRPLDEFNETVPQPIAERETIENEVPRVERFRKVGYEKPKVADLINLPGILKAGAKIAIGDARRQLAEWEGSGANDQDLRSLIRALIQATEEGIDALLILLEDDKK